MSDRTLFDPPHFDGATYVPKHDHERLTCQLGRVLYVLRDKRWRTLGEVAEAIEERCGCSDPEASISARLRDLRKPKFGGHEVHRRRRGEAKRGVYEYQLIPQDEETRA